MWTTRYTTRAPALVVDEIEDYVRRYGAENFDFYDLTAIVKRDWILEFCRLLDARGLRITWQLPSGTRSEALDEPVLRAMYRSGCRNVSYAPESGSERTLEAIQKKVKLERLEASMRTAVRVGLNVKANILIGFPDEQVEDLRETLRFILRMARIGVHDVSVWTFSPYPGSELFERLRDAGRLPRLDDDYYASLLSYSDVSGAVSYADALDSVQLQRYRVAGLLLFYGASYLTHPARPLRSLYNILHAPLRVAHGDVASAICVRRLSMARGPRSRRCECASPSSPAASSISGSRRCRPGCGRRGTSRRWCTRHGRSRRARGTDSALLARLLDPRPEETAERIVATRPDVVAFTSYSVTHRWAVEVARAVKRSARRRSSSAGRTCRRRLSARSASGRSMPSSRGRARARWST